MASIAVIVVNYNGGDLLEPCLSHILDQTRRADQLIVVDNASSDDSLNALSKFPGIELVQLKENLGFAAASNRGIECAASCDWVAMLNPDAFAAPDWLQTVENAIEKNSGYRSFATRMMSHKSPGVLDGAGDAYHVSGRPWRISHGKPLSDASLVAQEVFGPCAAAGVYNRDALRHAQGFDEDFFCYLEDVDLAFRMQLLGYRCLYVPEAVVHHIGSAITGLRSDFQVYHAHRNLVWTFFKNMPLALLLIFLPLHLVLNLVTIILYSARGRGRLIIKSKWHALTGLLNMLRKRRAISSSRQSSLSSLIMKFSFRFD